MHCRALGLIVSTAMAAEACGEVTSDVRGSGGNRAASAGADGADGDSRDLGGAAGGAILPRGTAGEAGAESCDADARAVGHSESVYALEVARAMNPETALRIGISLPEPASVPGQTLEQRQAELAAYQDPIRALLGERGASNLESFSFIDLIYADLPARYVSEVFCWPSVLGISSEASYWEVVARPWDLASVGSAECPLANGTCPPHCRDLPGTPYDRVGECLSVSELVACSVRERQGSLEGYCGVATRTDRIYCFFPTGEPREPDFLGWRSCTPDEEAMCSQALTTCP